MGRYEQVNSKAVSDTPQSFLVYTLDTIDFWLAGEGTLQMK
jgi:hypothetical protein